MVFVIQEKNGIRGLFGYQLEITKDRLVYSQLFVNVRIKIYRDLHKNPFLSSTEAC